MQPSDELEMHWAAEMGLRLLQARHASEHGHGSSGGSTVDWGPWIASLPARVVTPVEFTTREVEALTIPSTVQVCRVVAEQPAVTPAISQHPPPTPPAPPLWCVCLLPSPSPQAVLDVRASLEGCYELLQPELAAIGCGWGDFLWAVQVGEGVVCFRLSPAWVIRGTLAATWNALSPPDACRVQVLHSRCFYEPTSQRHLAVPAVDMSNHSSAAPNATVRLVHSPAACQGLQALKEVAPAAVEAVTASFFQLVVGAWGCGCVIHEPCAGLLVATCTDASPAAPCLPWSTAASLAHRHQHPQPPKVKQQQQQLIRRLEGAVQ
jgi:hypothetical protein